MMPNIFQKLRIITLSIIKLLFIITGVSFITFYLLSLAPGDPIEEILRTHHEHPSPERIIELKKELGLDKPLLIQYSLWIFNILKLDFGKSFITGKPVFDEILTRFPVTFKLALLSFFFIIFLCIIGGVISALNKSKLPDKIHHILTIVLISIPDYLVGIMLILFFSVYLGLLPIKDDGLQGYILPVITLGLSISAIEGRILRSIIIEVQSQDYIRFATLKGLSIFRIILRHSLRPALVPMISIWGILLGHLLGGAVIVESVFSLPGLGTYLIDSVLRRDIPAIQGTVFFVTTIFIILNQSIDFIYQYLDPHINFKEN